MSLNLQKRVTIRRHNYFYKPIDGTPFCLGLALPEGYGMYELRAEQEIKHSIVNGKFAVIVIIVDMRTGFASPRSRAYVNITDVVLQ